MGRRMRRSLIVCMLELGRGAGCRCLHQVKQEYSEDFGLLQTWQLNGRSQGQGNTCASESTLIHIIMHELPPTQTLQQPFRDLISRNMS